MTKLKTAEELEIGMHVGDVKQVINENRILGSDFTASIILAGDLKQEAIKYLKKLREDQIKLASHPRQKDWKQASLMIEGQIGWITYFFNITE